MPKEYDNTNTGLLARNQKQRAGSKDCDFTGFLTDVECPHCRRKFSAWLNAWTKEAKNASKIMSAGQKYFSLSVKPREEDGNSGGGNQNSSN